MTRLTAALRGWWREHSHRRRIERFSSGEQLGLLFGYAAIGRFLGLTKGQARDLVRRRVVPCFYLGGVPCALRASLVQHLIRLETEHGQRS